MQVEGDFRFLTPTTISITGASSSGKTSYLVKILKKAEHLFDPKPKNLIIVYSQYQDLYDEIKKLENFDSIRFVEGFNINIEEVNDAILVFDDQMRQLFQNPGAGDLFLKFSHHNRVTVITLTQNLFPTGKYSKDIRLNIHYYVIMKSFTLQSQVKYLGLQLFSQYKHFLVSAYKKACEKRYSALVINLHPQTDDLIRVVSNIFEKEGLIVYLPVSSS